MQGTKLETKGFNVSSCCTFERCGLTQGTFGRRPCTQMAVPSQLSGDSLQCLPQSAAVLFHKGPFLLHERSAEGRQYSLLRRLKNILRTSYFPLMLMHSDIYYKWILCIYTNNTCNTCTAYMFIHNTLFSCWAAGCYTT